LLRFFVMQFVWTKSAPSKSMSQKNKPMSHLQPTSRPRYWSHIIRLIHGLWAYIFYLSPKYLIVRDRKHPELGRSRGPITVAILGWSTASVTWVYRVNECFLRLLNRIASNNLHVEGLADLAYIKTVGRVNAVPFHRSNCY